MVHVALTDQQVTDYGLPPQPGKSTDPRAAGFKARHGALIQVELDALPPDVLHELYTDAVEAWWEGDVYDSLVEREQAERDRL